METTIYTIGHSSHDVRYFVGLLCKHGVQVLVDVRSEPHSRHVPQFNKADLQRAVEEAGIRYRYSGAYIGGKPKDPSMVTPNGKPDYDKLAASRGFQSELRAVVELARTKRVALMCSEADPAACHRGRILTPVLRSLGIEVLHIAPDGRAEEEEQGTLF